MRRLIPLCLLLAACSPITLSEDETGDSTTEQTNENVLSIGEFLETDTTAVVSVWGYIVGYVKGNSITENSLRTACGMDETTNTNIVIGEDPQDIQSSRLVAVQLPSGTLRTTYDLTASDTLIGTPVKVRGTASTYFGQPGIKSTQSIVPFTPDEASGGTTTDGTSTDGTTTDGGYATLRMYWRTEKPADLISVIR